MLEMLMWSFWLALGAYIIWYLFKAKALQPLTLDQLALTWKLHKQQSNCSALQIQNLITKHGKVVGFQCECGYKFLQKRLLTQKAPSTETNMTPSISTTMTPQKIELSPEELERLHACTKEN